MVQVRGKIGGYMSTYLRLSGLCAMVWSAELNARADAAFFEANKWRAKLREYPRKRRKRRRRS
jgi:hypothetical protein